MTHLSLVWLAILFLSLLSLNSCKSTKYVESHHTEEATKESFERLQSYMWRADSLNLSGEIIIYNWGSQDSVWLPSKRIVVSGSKVESQNTSIWGTDSVFSHDLRKDDNYIVRKKIVENTALFRASILMLFFALFLIFIIWLLKKNNLLIK